MDLIRSQGLISSTNLWSACHTIAQDIPAGLDDIGQDDIVTSVLGSEKLGKTSAQLSKSTLKWGSDDSKAKV